MARVVEASPEAVRSASEGDGADVGKSTILQDSAGTKTWSKTPPLILTHQMITYQAEVKRRVQPKSEDNYRHDSPGMDTVQS
jgi:hypothetical protein